MPRFNFKNIIWDVDGTLFDTYPAISAAILAALAEQGVTIDREIVTHMAMTSLGTTLPDLAKRFKLDHERLFVRYDFFLAGTPLGSQRPFPGVKQVLQRVVRNGGMNLIATHRGKDSLIPMLKYHRLYSLFTDMLSIHDGYPRKPNPAMFNTLIERTWFKPKRRSRSATATWTCKPARRPVSVPSCMEMLLTRCSRKCIRAIIMRFYG